MKKFRTVAYLLGTMMLVLALASPAVAQSSVANKVYAVSVTTSFGTTFTDCFRFTANSLAIDGCGDSGPLTEVNLGQGSYSTVWLAKVPCGGLNLLWVGTSADGSLIPSGQSADVASGSGTGLSQGTNFATAGLLNSACPASAAKNGLNYTKALKQ